jgi:TPR repeat protein
MKTFRWLFTVLVLAFVLTRPVAAWADFYDGLRAFDAGDHGTAFAEWKAAADSGDAKAQFRLAELYEDGLGTPQNFVQAHVYYNLAGAQGDAEARAARDAIAENMTKEELARARGLAVYWKPAETAETTAAAAATASTDTATTAATTTGATDDSVPPSEPAPHGLVTEVQDYLNLLGYEAGDADGVAGPATRLAIES